MGLFSSETKTIITVDSRAMSLLDAPDNPHAEATLYSILRGSSLPDELLDSASNGIASKMRNVYKYGLEDYPLGLPSGNISGEVQIAETLLKGIIETDINKNILIIYSLTTELTPALAASSYLLSTRGYKRSTNEITIHSFPVTFADKKVELDYVEYLPETEQFTIHYKAVDRVYSFYASGSYQLFSETISKPANLIIGNKYCIVAYYELNISGAVIPNEKMWFYNTKLDTYPELSIPSVNIETTGFFPVIPIRYNNRDLTTNKDDGLYVSSSTLLKKMSIDMDTIAEKLNENPGIANIDHAYIMFAVPINTTNKDSMYYLMQFFDYLYDKSIYNKNDYVSATNQKTLIGNLFFTKLLTNLLSPPDIIFQEYGLNISLNYSYITSDYIEGSIGKVGSISSTIVTQPINTLSALFSGDNNYVRFRYQLNTAMYKEVTVYGLLHKNSIYQGHSVMTSLSNLEGDPDECSLLIPIHYEIASNLPLFRRNGLFMDGCRLIINCYHVQTIKIKWYQKGIFKAVFFIGAIAITAISGQGWLVGLAAAAQVGAMAVITYLLPAILIGAIISVGSKYIAKVLGPELGMIIGIVAIVAAISIPAGSTFRFMSFKVPTAQTFLQFGNAVMDASNQLIANQIDEVMKEIEKFDAEAEKKWSELEAAQELLDSGIALNPMKMLNSVQAYIADPNESPDAFYNRTIHTPNIGILTLDVIENYTSVMLALPKPKLS